MDLAPATASASPASDRCMARAKCIVRVKFVGMPIREMAPEVTRELADARHPRAGGGPILRFLTRVIGRLVAARP